MKLSYALNIKNVLVAVLRFSHGKYSGFPQLIDLLVKWLKLCWLMSKLNIEKDYSYVNRKLKGDVLVKKLK